MKFPFLETCVYFYRKSHHIELKPKYEVDFLEEAVAFLEKLDPKARKKVIYNIDKSRYVNDSKLFKKLDDDIWEFRTKFNGQHHRLLAFWVRLKTKP